MAAGGSGGSGVGPREPDARISAAAEYWIPAEELGAFNAAIVGEIEVIAEYR